VDNESDVTLSLQDEMTLTMGEVNKCDDVFQVIPEFSSPAASEAWRSNITNHSTSSTSALVVSSPFQSVSSVSSTIELEPEIQTVRKVDRTMSTYFQELSIDECVVCSARDSELYKDHMKSEIQKMAARLYSVEKELMEKEGIILGLREDILESENCLKMKIREFEEERSRCQENTQFLMDENAKLKSANKLHRQQGGTTKENSDVRSEIEELKENWLNFQRFVCLRVDRLEERLNEETNSNASQNTSTDNPLDESISSHETTSDRPLDEFERYVGAGQAFISQTSPNAVSAETPAATAAKVSSKPRPSSSNLLQQQQEYRYHM
jgi:hypothetical protein